MNLYSQEEIDRITKVKETNDKLEEFFNDKRTEWNKTVEPLFKVLSVDLSNPSNSKEILNAQSLALTHRQQINEQVNFFLNKRSKETTKIKKLRQDKFVFYATGFGIKTNLGEKGILIDGHLAENDRCIELIESYIEFLRDTVRNLESLGFSIKNMIELLNYLGR
jgi:coenzyme F420-reducing hydrogenase gamma subunit